jgi:SagB-type dehydrogenase family enzyme
MKSLAVLFSVALALPAFAAPGSQPVTATGVVRQMNALDTTDFLGVRMLAFQADKVETLSLVVKSADGPARDSWLARLPEATRGRYEERFQQLGSAGPEQVASAVATVAALLNGPDLLLMRAQTLAMQDRPRESAEAAERAFKLGVGARFDYYVAASMWARAGDKDAAFRNLDRAAAAGWIDTKTTADDSDLVSLHQDKRWNTFFGRITATRDSLFAALPDSHPAGTVVALPAPALDGKVSVEKCLAERRSIRKYANAPLTIAEVSQLLWSAYGVTQPMPGVPGVSGGLKTAPSAGGLYPLELHLVAGNVTGLEPGVWSYRPASHDLVLVDRGDKRQALYDASGSQTWVKDAPASIVYSAVFSRNTDKYGTRGRERYVCMDLGHSAENVYLQCGSLGLGTCAIGAFLDDDLRLIVKMTKPEEPLYIMPVGRLPTAK